MGAGNCRCHVVLLKWRLHSRLGTNLDKGSKINYARCITPDLLLLPLSFSLGRSSSSVSNLNGSSATGCEGKNYLLLVLYGLTTGQSNLLFKLVIISSRQPKKDLHMRPRLFVPCSQPASQSKMAPNTWNHMASHSIPLGLVHKTLDCQGEGYLGKDCCEWWRLTSWQP